MARARTTEFGRTLIIANPQAQAGNGAAAAERLQRFLSLYLHSASEKSAMSRVDGPAAQASCPGAGSPVAAHPGAALSDAAHLSAGQPDVAPPAASRPHCDPSFTLTFTERPGHAVELAAEARGFDTVCALGGDGVIHEVVNGLMRIPRAERPALALVPIGSGNDYARTLGYANWEGRDFSFLLALERAEVDVGRVTHEGGVAYFAETCAFGLDAAIGLGVEELKPAVPVTGAALYAASGLKAFGRDYRMYPATVAFDDEPAQRLLPLMFAMQIGPTYGSGFRVCPDADPADGLLDVCYAEGPFPRAAALAVFLAVKGGHHTGIKRMRLRRARRVALALEGAYPVQVDGERLSARSMVVEVLPRALTVLRPRR